MSWVKWDDARKGAAEIGNNRHAKAPDGTQIHHVPGGFEIKSRTGRHIEYRSGNKGSKHALETAKRVRDLSAKSVHPKSPGGAKKYPSFDKFKSDKTNAANRAKTQANKYDPLHGKFGTNRPRSNR